MRFLRALRALRKKQHEGGAWKGMPAKGMALLGVRALVAGRGRSPLEIFYFSLPRRMCVRVYEYFSVSGVGVFVFILVCLCVCVCVCVCV